MIIRLTALGIIWYTSLLVYSTMRRSAFTTSLLERYANDERHRRDEHEYWYQIKLDLVDAEISAKFIQLNEDEETKKFLTNCYEKSDAIIWQLYHSVAIPFLKLFMTQTNVNGYLERGSMFVFSAAQFNKLLSIDETWKTDTLLDLGAGDGKVAEQMSSHFKHVYATEVSSQMQRHLRTRGFSVLSLDEWTQRKYDVITCLNLLDRCDKPLSLLKDIKHSLQPNGRLVVASVSPYSPFVEESKSTNYRPSEMLDIYDAFCIEDQVNLMVKNIFSPLGFSLEAFSRVPYLCEGDLTTSFYVLHDIIFVLKLSDGEGD